MAEGAGVILWAAAVGIGGTAILDLWSFLLQQLFGLPATNWSAHYLIGAAYGLLLVGLAGCGSRRSCRR